MPTTANTKHISISRKILGVIDHSLALLSPSSQNTKINQYAATK